HSFFMSCYCPPPDLHSFPTRRSSDLSFSALSSSTRAASQSFRVPVLCFVIAPLLSWLGFGVCLSRDKVSAGYRDDGSYKCGGIRSEEHTSELQSRGHLVCRLLLEKKK